MFLVYQASPPCKRRVIGGIVKIAEMIAGITGEIVGIEEITAQDPMGTTIETNRKVFAMGWIEDGKMLVTAGLSIRITPAISETETVPTVKASVEATRKAIAKIITGDGKQEIA